MKLQSIAIEEFKQFTGRLFIDDLQPGLNLFVGPNEAGKSTIARLVESKLHLSGAHTYNFCGRFEVLDAMKVESSSACL